MCVRVQGHGPSPTTTKVSTRKTSLPALVRLRDDLAGQGVEAVVIESTSDYWRPVFYVLSERLHVVLVKASDVKQIPGRKTDVADSQWLAELLAHGLVRASFVPPENQRHLRDLTRARVAAITERTREVQRLEKELEDACIKLSAVVSDLQGVSATAMLKAIANAEHAIVTSIWHMLTTGECYHDLGADHYTRRLTQKAINRKIHDLQALGHTINPAV